MGDTTGEFLVVYLLGEHETWHSFKSYIYQKWFLHSDNNQWCFEIAWEVANKVGIVVVVGIDINMHAPYQIVLGWWDLHSDQKQDWSVRQRVGRPVHPPRTLQGVPRQARGEQITEQDIAKDRIELLRSSLKGRRGGLQSGPPTGADGEFLVLEDTWLLLWLMWQAVQKPRLPARGREASGLLLAGGLSRGTLRFFKNVKMSHILFCLHLSKLNTQVILFDVESAAVKLSEWKQEL